MTTKKPLKKPVKKKMSKSEEIAEQTTQIHEIERDKARVNIDKIDLIEDMGSSNDIKMDDKLLSDEFDIELNSNEPIRELLTAKNIKFKTEITQEERGTISILYTAYLHSVNLGLNIPVLKNILDQYIDFGVSVGREGRKEYVDAHKSQLLAQQLQNNMNKPNSMDNIKM